MKNSEAAILLASIARTDRRTFGEPEVISWADLMTKADVPLHDAINAAQDHFGTSHDYLMPIHIIERVKVIRRERMQRAGIPPIPGDLTQAQERAWRVLWCDAVKAGDADPAATASNAMRLPLELEPTPVPAEERDRLIENLANARSVRRAMTAEPKPRRFSRWGRWVLGSENADGHIAFSADGTVLYHDGGPWGIELSEFRTRDDMTRWAEHIEGKGWGTQACLRDLAAAFMSLNPAEVTA